MDFWKLSRNNTCVSIPEKLSEIHLHALLFSNPQGKVIIFIKMSYSLDLRVQHKTSEEHGMHWTKKSLMIFDYSWLSQKDQMPVKCIAKTFFQRQEWGEWIYLRGKRDPKLFIVIDVTLNVMESKTQSHTFFIIALCWKTQSLIIITLPWLEVLINILFFFFILLRSFSLIISCLVNYLFLLCRALPERIFPTEHWWLGQLASWWNTLAWNGRHPFCDVVPPHSVSFLICWEQLQTWNSLNCPFLSETDFCKPWPAHQ